MRKVDIFKVSSETNVDKKMQLLKNYFTQLHKFTSKNKQNI